MFVDKIENLSKLSSQFKEISELIKYVNNYLVGKELKKIDTNNLQIIPLKSKNYSGESTNPIHLELHRQKVDLHITLSGIDIICYEEYSQQNYIVKDYDDINDYLIVRGNIVNKIEVPSGYFCLIRSQYAHAALSDGHKNVIKIVAKLTEIK